MSSLSFPYTVSVNSNTPSYALTIAQLEKNLSKIEEACIHNATNRSGYSSSISNPSTLSQFASVCGSDNSARYGSYVVESGCDDYADRSAADTSDCSYDYGDASFCSPDEYSFTAVWNNSANFSPNATFNYDHYHASKTGICTSDEVTVHTSNNKSGGGCSSDSNYECGFNYGNTFPCSSDCPGNYSTNNRSNFRWDFGSDMSAFTTYFSGKTVTIGLVCFTVNSTNFTANYGSNCPSNNASNFTARNNSNYTTFNSSYTIEGIDF